MLRITIVAIVAALGLYAFWDTTRVRPLEPRLTVKWSPVLRPGEVPDPQYNGGAPPWNENEKIFKRGRDLTRKSTMESLDQAWSTFCTPEGQAKLATTINYYFEKRANEEASYTKRWGNEGRDYIKKEWSTADDNRIERLMTETYERGYLDLASIWPDTRKHIAPLLKDSRVTGQPCKM